MRVLLLLLALQAGALRLRAGPNDLSVMSTAASTPGEDQHQAPAISEESSSEDSSSDRSESSGSSSSSSSSSSSDSSSDSEEQDEASEHEHVVAQEYVDDLMNEVNRQLMPPACDDCKYLVDRKLKVETKLGTGATAEVFGYSNSEVKKAVKVFLEDDDEAGNDADLVIGRYVGRNQTQFPHTLGYEAVCEEPSKKFPQGFAVLPWVESTPAKDLKALSCSAKVGYLLQVEKALERLHAAGIFHLDVKGENVLALAKDGAVDANLIDFGASRYCGADPALTGLPGCDVVNDEEAPLTGTETYWAKDLVKRAEAKDADGKLQDAAAVWKSFDRFALAVTALDDLDFCLQTPGQKDSYCFTFNNRGKNAARKVTEVDAAKTKDKWLTKREIADGPTKRDRVAEQCSAADMAVVDRIVGYLDEGIAQGERGTSRQRLTATTAPANRLPTLRE